MSDANANLENAEPENGADAPETCVQLPEAPPIRSQHQQIRKWLEDASREHRGDVYSGKRDETRFKKPVQLDAKFFESGDVRTAMATMHNISCTGIAFWVRGEAELGTIVEVGECDPTTRISWVSAKITHCRQGLRGFVVGAQFEAPLADPPSSWDESMADLGPVSEEEVEPADLTNKTEECEIIDATQEPEATAPFDRPEAIGATEPTDTKEPPDGADPPEKTKGESDRGILSWFGLG